MSKRTRKKDPFRTLLKSVAVFVVASIVFGAAFYGLGAYAQYSLDQKKKDIEARNKQKTEQYQAALAEYQSALSKGENVDWPAPKPEGWDIVDLTAFGLENTNTVPTDRGTLLMGGMLLVNQWHALPADFLFDNVVVSVISGTSKRVGAADNTVKLFTPAVKALDDMVRDATTAGFKNLFVSEGYRSMERQTQLFEAAKASLESKYSGDTLIEQAKKQVNAPGTSEYQSGFAFTMSIYPNPDKLYFQDSDQGKWFTANCWQYGIIFRFPAADFPNSSWTDKSYKTGVTMKLNLYRWVGVPNATAMHILDMCMEEYVEYLMAHPHIAIYQDNKLKYEIFRQQVGDASSVNVQVPQAASTYLASLDNMGGLITAYTYQ